MVISFYLSLAYLSPPYSVGLTILLWGYWTETCNKSFGTICFSEWPLIETLIESFAIRDFTTGVCSRMQSHRMFFHTCIDFCRSLPIWNNLTQPMACSECFTSWFNSTHKFYVCHQWYYPTIDIFYLCPIFKIFGPKSKILIFPSLFV